MLGNGANNGVTLSFDGTALGDLLPTNGNPFALVIVRAREATIRWMPGPCRLAARWWAAPATTPCTAATAETCSSAAWAPTRLYAGSGGDILMGGTTTYDSNLTALAFTMAEWDRTDVSYTTRVKQLSGSLSGGLNGSYFLSSTTVFDDHTTDVLSGGAGLDWFFAHLKGKNTDQVKNLTSGEVITGI